MTDHVCGCGTNIFCSGTEALHVAQTHSITMQLLEAARKTNVDILFESRKEVAFDKSRSLTHPDAIHQYKAFLNRGYDMPENLENPNFFCDKFVVWYQTPDQLEEFRKVSDPYFTCIDRGGTFREFVPIGYAKRPASSMCLTIIIWILTPPMRSATATTIFRCSLRYQTASPGNASPASLI